MNPQINNEEVETIIQYIENLNPKAQETKERQTYGFFTDHELTQVFPAIRKLLRFAADQKQQLPEDLRKHNFDYMYHAGEANPKHTFELALKMPHLLKELIKACLLLEIEKVRQYLLGKEVSKMTGFEYELYKKMID